MDLESNPLEENEKLEVGANTSGSQPTIEKTSEKKDRVDWAVEQIKRAKPHVERQRKHMKQRRRFFDGKQLSDEDKKILQRDKRPDNAFNTAQKFVRLTSGVEREAPEALIFSPIDESDEKQQLFGETVTRAYDWFLAKSKANFERSIAFEDLIIGGMAWTDSYIDRNRDPRGLPGYCRIDPDEMWWPETNRQNLEDTRWRGRESWIDEDDAIKYWPKQKREIYAASGKYNERGGLPQTQNPIQYEIPQIQTKPIDDSAIVEGKKGKVLVLEMQFYEDVDGYYFFDPLEQNDTWMDEKTFHKYRARLKKLFPAEDPRATIDQALEQTRRVYKKMFLLNRRTLLGEIINMPGDRFTFNCMTGTYDPEDKIFWGWFSILVEPSRFVNKFWNQVLEIMGVQAKGGLIAEEGSIKQGQVDAIKTTWSQAGSVNFVGRGAISGKKIEQKKLPELPQSSMAIMQFCMEVMTNVTGVNPDAMGQGTSPVPGVTLRRRQKSGLVLLAREFDALSRFRIDEGYIIFDLLKSLADNNRLIRSGGLFDSAIIRLMQEPFVAEYDLLLDDTERDPNIRREYEENVQGLAPTLIRMQMFLPELLDYVRLPFRFKQKLKKAILDKAEADRQRARMGEGKGGRGSQKTPEERQADIEKVKADTQLQMAKIDRVKMQTQRDQARTILETHLKLNQAKIDREAHGAEMAAKALELRNAALGIRTMDARTPQGRRPA